MKLKLQVLQPSGEWLWVRGWDKPSRVLVTTTSKREALPPKTYWYWSSLEAAQRIFPGHTFRLAGSREE